MAKPTGKPVKIVKRSERESGDAINAIDSSSDSRTPAQARREMVAVVISWISDRKTAVPTRLCSLRG